MSAFNPQKVMRQISNKGLQELFAHFGVEIKLDGLKPQKRNAAVFDAFIAMPSDMQQTMEFVLNQANGLATEQGMEVALQLTGGLGEHLEEWAAMDSNLDRAVWFYLHHERSWASVMLFNAADQKMSGRCWEKRDGMPHEPPDITESAKQGLTSDLSAYFTNHDGRGRRGVLEYVLRPDGYHYFFLYFSDYVHSIQCIDDEEGLVRHTLRTTFDVVLAYSPADGVLETYAQGGKKVIAEIQRIFTRRILHTELPPQRKGQIYNLNRVLDPQFSFITDYDDAVENVFIQRFSYTIMGREKSVCSYSTLVADGFASAYDHLDNDLNHRRVTRSIINITRLSIEMQIRKNDKIHRFSFYLTDRNTTNLNNKDGAFVALAKKYLKKWGIDASNAG